MAQRIYLSRTEVAARIGVKPDTLGRYRLPEPDAMIGTVRGWLPDTVDRWHDSRPRVRNDPPADVLKNLRDDSVT